MTFRGSLPSPSWTVLEFATWYAGRHGLPLETRRLGDPGIVLVTPARVVVDPAAASRTLEANTIGAALLKRPEDRRSPRSTAAWPLL